MPKALLGAVKKSGGAQVSADPGSRPADVRSWLADRVAESGLHLDRTALDAISQTLGQDVGRLGGVLDTLVSAYGPDARLDADDVTPYLGEAGGGRAVGPHRRDRPWRHRQGDRGPAPIHPANHALVVMASLHNHVQRMLALDGAGARSDKEAAELLGLKGSTYPAKKPSTRAAGSARRRSRRPPPCWPRPTSTCAAARTAPTSPARGAGGPPGEPVAPVARRRRSARLSPRRRASSAAWPAGCCDGPRLFLWITPFVAALSMRFWARRALAPRVVGALGGDGDGVLHVGAELRTDGLVALVPTGVLLVALDLALDVRHVESSALRDGAGRG